jgi:hypothetical protein
MKHNTTHFSQAKTDKEERIWPGNIDPILVKNKSAREKMADEIKQIRIECAALSLGSRPIERKQYYSQTFLMSPEFVTNGLRKH